MSGLESVLARIGAIERRVSSVHAATAGGGTSGAPTFADALQRATLADAGRPSVTEAADAPIATPVAPATVSAPRTPPTRPPEGTASRAAGPAYRPAHVTETDERVWNDCTWASAAMWIDKLTGGAVKVDREALRAASGDRTGGSSLGDVVRGARRLLGLDLRAAHAERLTVDGLLERLASGGGAVVQGSYASLPAKLTRHDPGFAARGVAASGHAVYVGPLDRATGKVWWDDPLAPAGGSGQWISVHDLRKFLWTDGHGRVSALATPAGTASPAVTATTRGARPEAAGADAASIAAVARSSGVDPLLLTAYLDVAATPRGPGAIAAGATDLATALSRFGRADLALESLGAAQAGSSRLAGGALFAGDVLREWAELIDRPAGA